MKTTLALLILLVGLGSAVAQIPHPDDAPKPLSPTEAVKSFHLPPGYAMKLELELARVAVTCPP